MDLYFLCTYLCKMLFQALQVFNLVDTGISRQLDV